MICAVYQQLTKITAAENAK